MTIYATTLEIDGNLTTVLAASDSVEEMTEFYTTNVQSEKIVSDNMAVKTVLTKPIEHLMTYRDLIKFKKPVVLVFHSDQSQADKFTQSYDIVNLGIRRLEDRQREMIDNNTVVEEDNRPLGEVLGLDKEDPFAKVVSKHDMSASVTAPKNVTGSGGQGGNKGTLKSTREQLIENKDKAIEKKMEEILQLVKDGKVGSTELSDHLTNNHSVPGNLAGTLLAKVVLLLQDGTIAESKDTGGISDEVQSLLDELVELNDKDYKEFENKPDDAFARVGIIRQEQHGNTIQITGIVRSDDEMEQAKLAIEEMRENKRKKKATGIKLVRSVAEKLGVDVDKPNTTTAVDSEGTLHQQDDDEKTMTSITVEGKRTVRHIGTGTVLEETEIDLSEEKEEEVAFNPSDYSFAVDVDPNEDEEGWVYITGPVSSEADEMINGLALIKDGTVADKYEPDWTFYNDIDQVRNRILLTGLVEKPEVGPTQKSKYRYEVGKRGKQKPPIVPSDYYYAICPPGFHSDESAVILGQEGYVVVFPKEMWDEGKNPAEHGGHIPQKFLEKNGWTEVSNSVYMAETKTGNIDTQFRQMGYSENGMLLERMGLDMSSMPFDWPWQYHTVGQRAGFKKEITDLYKEAVAILKKAKEAGITVSDKEIYGDGTVNENVERDKTDITQGVVGALNQAGVPVKEKAEKEEKDDTFFILR